ncbi:hypothetical protein DICPUDRAFT_83535 [Dictyostelium purpureum]|uniref:Transposase Tc1-like domain-containing protein n=1 Tax=Dictyostelium purpureum TaxID=5786 RepID=F0ZZT7_DICPU|nr:uncharacterized protein DICPUDRAFT_83535 [Dictyostelium purpureum]EGC30544.1 hypothetical protein DICPUDRAFT_83535 [Dictyostelium purpureum]|eukprot:XP_003292939.1 hypothetical protein DICPUDRAFT_83535 [Dictyostelium purpureum]
MALSLEKRELIIENFLQGKSDQEIAILIGVDRSTIYRIRKHYQKTNSLEPKPIPGRPRKYNERTERFCKKSILNGKSNNAGELSKLVQKSLDIRLSNSTIGRILKRQNIFYKYSKCNKKNSKKA